MPAATQSPSPGSPPSEGGILLSHRVFKEFSHQQLHAQHICVYLNSPIVTFMWILGGSQNCEENKMRFHLLGGAFTTLDVDVYRYMHLHRCIKR